MGLERFRGGPSLAALSTTFGRLAGANDWTGQQDFAGAIVTGLPGSEGGGVVTADDPSNIFGLRDSSDRRTWLEVRESDGGPSRFAVERIAAGLGVPAPPARKVFVADGDSLTSDATGGGTNYVTKLAALLGTPILNNGSSGRRASEIALASGGLAVPIAIPGRTIPATTSAVACTPTLPDAGPNTNRTWSVSVQGVPCTLTYTHAGATWTLARQVTAASPTPVPATGAVAVPVMPYVGPGHVHLLWGGRTNVTTASAAMLKSASWMAATRTEFLLISVCNSTLEPSGSSDYDNVIALNTELRNAYPREYVELRGRLITEGLALAGLTATGADTTAISEDRIPPSLLSDGLHFNDSGRIAVAAIIRDELTYRGIV